MKKYILLVMSAIVLAVAVTNCSRNDDALHQQEQLKPQPQPVPPKDYELSADGKTLVQWKNEETTEIDFTKDPILSRVTTIADQAFRGHLNLQKVALPTSLTSIGKEAFDGCRSLKSVRLPESITKIEYGTFYGCEALTTINLNKVKTIEDFAFSGCIALANVEFSSIETLGSYSFQKTAITSIEFPSSIETIGNEAFLLCPKLVRVIVNKAEPPTLKMSFDGCLLLNNILVPAASVQKYKEDDGWGRYEVKIKAKPSFTPDHFVGIWTADIDNKIKLPVYGKYSYSYEKVGDDTIKGSGKGDSSYSEIRVSSAGDYFIFIKPEGEFRFHYGIPLLNDMQEQFKELMQWGKVNWSSNLGDMFNGCRNLTITATDIPDFSQVKFMTSMFEDCAQITTIPNINKWNTSNVKSMTAMFERATQFNQDISGWNVSNVESMHFMFQEAKAFNQNLGTWVITGEAALENIFTKSGMSCESYSKTLKGWAENPQTGKEVKLISDRTYGIGADTYRNKLINHKKWKISGDKYDSSCNLGL